MKKKVVIGFLGTQLDSGLGAARWEKWRSTVLLAQQDAVSFLKSSIATRNAGFSALIDEIESVVS